MADAEMLTRSEAAKRYGVRVKDMAAKCCLSCHKPLGRRPSKVWTSFARFGQLLFFHVACLKEDD